MHEVAELSSKRLSASLSNLNDYVGLLCRIAQTKSGIEGPRYISVAVFSGAMYYELKLGHNEPWRPNWPHSVYPPYAIAMSYAGRAERGCGETTATRLFGALDHYSGAGANDVDRQLAVGVAGLSGINYEVLAQLILSAIQLYMEADEDWLLAGID